uniref:Uncharacterized protein n=1 Tax=Podoviridae sp. ctlpi2 TaxID=2826574 RepID=A0A8S5ML99_9CAUD|nr:MAG TPA: hypothetical protein [Podoviridae sp. ctlpi2]
MKTLRSIEIAFHGMQGECQESLAFHTAWQQVQQARLLLAQAAWNIGIVSNDPAFTQMFADGQDDKRRVAAEKWLSDMAKDINDVTGEL